MKKTTKRIKTLKAVYDELERDKRGPFIFSLNVALHERFKRACEEDGQPISRVIEKLIKQYIGPDKT